jgi:hypothetical protein
MIWVAIYGLTMPLALGLIALWSPIHAALQSAQLAAWVQAIGSIGAIVGSVWLQGRAHSIAQSDALRATEGRVLAAVQDTYVIASGFGDEIRTNPSEAVLDYFRRQIERRLRIIEAVQTGAMPIEVYDKLLDIITALESYAHWIDGVLVELRLGVALPVAELDDYEEGLAEARDFIRAKYGAQALERFVRGSDPNQPIQPNQLG